jgi:hypothetical protein
MGKSDHGSTKLELRELEPWPEQVDGAVLLNDLSATFSRHLALLDGAADVMALWVMFTHGFDAAKVSRDWDSCRPCLSAVRQRHSRF